MVITSTEYNYGILVNFEIQSGLIDKCFIVFVLYIQSTDGGFVKRTTVQSGIEQPQIES